MRALRMLALVLSLLLFSTGAIGQSPVLASESLGETQTELAKWAVTQGGLFLVVLLLVWSYRRDFTRVLAGEQDRADRALTLMQATTAALVTHSEALRVLTNCVNTLAENVKACQLVQQVLHTKVDP